MWLEEGGNAPPPPPWRPLIRSHRRKLFMLDIATVNPLLFYETGSKCTEGYYTGANCRGFLKIKKWVNASMFPLYGA